MSGIRLPGAPGPSPCAASGGPPAAPWPGRRGAPGRRRCGAPARPPRVARPRPPYAAGRRRSSGRTPPPRRTARRRRCGAGRTTPGASTESSAAIASSACQVSSASSRSRSGTPMSSHVAVTRRSEGSMKRCTSAMSTAIAVFTAGQVEVLAEGEDRPGPVVEEVAVVDEGTLLAAGGALGVQHHVDPGGGAGDGALVGPGAHPAVVGLLGADHLGHRPQHRDVRRRGVAAVGGRAPEAEEPGRRAGP